MDHLFIILFKQGSIPIINPNDLDCRGHSAWFWLINSNCKDAVHHLFEQGHHPDDTPEKGTHPLFLAVELRHPIIVQQLLDHGASPYKISPEGKTPFQEAMTNLEPYKIYEGLDPGDDQWAVVKLFLEYPGIDLNVPYDHEKTVAELLQDVLTSRPSEIDDNILKHLDHIGAQHQAKQEHNELTQHTAPALSQRHKARF